MVLVVSLLRASALGGDTSGGFTPEATSPDNKNRALIPPGESDFLSSMAPPEARMASGDPAMAIGATYEIDGAIPPPPGGRIDARPAPYPSP